jgi:AraC-like DNA-binding protein
MRTRVRRPESHLHPGAAPRPVSRQQSVMLERLLDGLNVDVEPVTTSVARRPARDGRITGVLPLACGARVHFGPHRVAILPPAPRRAVPTSNLESPDEEAPIVDGGVRIRITYLGGVSLFRRLTEPIGAPLTPASPLRRCLRDLLQELATVRPGRCAMVETLVRRLLVLMLRRSPAQGGVLSWMAAVRDSRLGRAVDAMQDAPAHAFTLPELAEVAGMSRSVFAARFADALAQSPIEYLKTLRLARAAGLLRHTDLPIKTVASQVGYSSRSAFTRAFIAHRGVAPHQFRATSKASRWP